MAKKNFNINTELTATIDQLTSKLNTANQRVNHFKNEAKKNKGEADIFNNLVKGAAKFLPAIGAAAAAQQVFQGTINTTNAAGDAWAVTQAGMKGALEGFYRTLGTGDWSNFLHNIITASDAAKELAKQLDELFEKNISKDLLNIDLDVELAQLKHELKLANAKGDDELVLEIEAKITDKANKKLENSLKVAQNTLDVFVNDIQKVTEIEGKTILDFLKNYNDDSSQALRDEIEKYEAGVKDLKQSISSFDIAIANPYNSADEKDKFRKLQQEKIKELEKYYKETLSEDAKVYQATLDAYNRTNDEKIKSATDASIAIQKLEIDRINETSRAETQAEAAKKRIQEREIKRVEELNKLIKDYNDKLLNVLSISNDLNNLEYEKPDFLDYDVEVNMSTSPLRLMEEELKLLQQAQIESLNPEIYQELGIEIDKLRQKMADFRGETNEASLSQIELLQLQIDSLNTMSGAFDAIGDAAQRFGNNTLAGMMSTISGMLKMITVVNQLQAAKAAEAITSATAEGAKSGPFPANLIAIATGVSAVMSVLSSIPKFEVGGVVGGSSFSGDKVLAGLNSGERILTAEQNKIFENLAKNQSNVGGTFKVEIEGDKLVGVLDNYNRRKNSYN